MTKKVSVNSVCEIRFGLYAQPEVSGQVAYLQVRQFDEDGSQIKNPSEYLDLNKKREPHLLQSGDVLFVGKGARLFAWRYHQLDGPAIASSIFFVLTPNQKLVYPDYLTAMLNAPQSRAAFRQIGGGTNILSIRKSELGAFQIPLPPLKQQKRVAALAQLHKQEVELVRNIIEQKQKFYTAVITKIINT